MDPIQRLRKEISQREQHLKHMREDFFELYGEEQLKMLTVITHRAAYLDGLKYALTILEDAAEAQTPRHKKGTG